jgi:aromatic-L-amino-acid decarboxylase
MLCLDMADKFKGIERSDSLTVDPHKGLNLPTGTGAIIVRDGRYLRVGGNRYGSYMQDIIDGSELSPTDVSPELSRHFRGLRMWLPLQLYGVTAFRAMLAEKRLLALYFRSAIARQPNFEVGPEPDLSVVLFRFVPDDCRDHTLVNKMIAESVARDGRVFFSSTTVEGIFWLRLAVLNFRTHLPHVDEAVAAIKEIAAKVWKQNEM